DVAAEEIFPTWSSGATLVLRPAEIPTILDFTQFIAQEELTVLNLPVPYWQEWVNQMPEIGYQESCPECVRLLVLGSDKVPSERFTTWQKYVGKDISWRNAYGPTEATITATVYGPQLSSEAKNTSFLPIGRPIANTEIYILDRNLQPVPVGVKGELHIGGAGLAQGYLNRPELTAQKFISNPFNSDNNSKLYKSRLYKTGDLARYLPDGNIEFIGRIDRQVKIRGFRIELGEIEAVLTQHPQVRESVVVANPDQNGDNRLTAYIVCDNAVLLQAENQQPSSSELRRCLKEKLPEYMVPSTFVILESLPLMPNGKLDRNALRAAEVLQQEQVTEEESKPIAPRSSTEEILSQIWAEILGRKRVGIHDNFFEMGGDSILSLQIVAKANQAGLQFTPKQIFQHQTIAELAAVVGSVPSIQAEQGLVSGPVALTPIQHWFFAENLPESNHYNQSVLLEVPQNLKAEPLKQAVEQLLLHHDALRLRYQFSGSSWEQINATADKEVPFAVVDLSQLPLEQQKATIESTAAQIQATLNLSEGPIVRVALFHLGNNKPNRLLFVIHHLAVDGVSWRILLEDLFAAYQQLLQGNPVQFPPKTTSFQEWASLLNNYAQSETVSKELDYWLKPSHGDIPCLPTDSPNSLEANTVASRKEVLVELSLEKTQALLEEVPAVYNTQINDVLLAALGETFAYWTGNDKVLIDLEGHGREELFENVDLSRTVGWFTTVFPIFLELQNTKNPGEVLKSIKEQLHSIPNRGIGYGILRYLSQDTTVRSQLEAIPQAEVSFNYLGKLDGSWLEYPGLTIAKESSGLTESPLGRRSHLIEIDGFVLDGKLQFNWKYSENIYRRATVEHLAQIFLEELESLIVHCLKSDVGGYTPSDFPEVDLDQQELDNLIDELTISEDSSFDFLEESGDLLDQQLDQQIDNLISQELKGF
ncbi:MAG: condensation domain-containing protein, partial [Cyanobacteria bacterium J06639_18]